jgi:hypothetical protein
VVAQERKLSKHQAEILINAVDTDRLQSVLADTLQSLLGPPAAGIRDWETLVRFAAERGAWAPGRAAEVRSCGNGALAELAAELNETRRL